MPLIYVFLFLAAFFAGLIDSIAGGGGLISLPALLACGLPAHIALGTNKMQSTCGTTFALANFHRNAKVVWRTAFIGIPFALLGSVLGAKIALIIPQIYLAKILVVLLPPAAILMFTSRTLIRSEAPLSTTHKTRRTTMITILVCLAIGIYDGFFGPGTGTFLIVALVIFMGIPAVQSSATAKTFNLASNIGAFFMFMVSGHIDYKIGAIMAGANICGNLIGSHLAIKRGDTFVQKIVYVSLALLFFYLVWKYYI